MTDLALAALARERAELAGEIQIEAGLARIARQRAELVHLDAVVRLLDSAASASPRTWG